MKGGWISIAVVAIAAVAALPARSHADDPKPIRIGDITSYSALPEGTRGYRQGWQLALDQINAKGGVLGRKLEIIARDDASKPATAVTVANELVGKGAPVAAPGSGNTAQRFLKLDAVHQPAAQHAFQEVVSR